ncbi:MAG: ABC transporter permease [Gammaproteobacteria bacterium]|nr:ABC transporter permease [Gammaproteobacteria bacterium]
MRPLDLFAHSLQVLRASAGRSLLTISGIAIGIAAVVLLTAIGKGVQGYVLAEFSQFGTHLLAVTPGKTQTLGVSSALFASVRPLSLDDAVALGRVAGVEAMVPGVPGSAEVKAGRRGRWGMGLGVNEQAPRLWNLGLARGRFLPADDLEAARAYVVLGSKMAAELFAEASPLGQKLRIGGESYRVIGVMQSKGQLLGFDLDDAVYIPVSRALALFDRPGLMEIDLLYAADLAADQVAERLRQRLLERHGREDFTLTSQDQILQVLGDILGMLSLAVAGLGGISLLVGAVGILSIMTIMVSERRAEVGLLRALGAGRAQVLQLFLLDAALLAGLGGLLGLAVGMGLALLLDLLLPALPVSLSLGHILLAEAIALGIGLVAGIAPALHAASLDPVDALRSE